ncbi:MAG: glycerophosphodiester phosphodiesterase family protein [Pseudomonadota bacterium]
MSPTDVFLGRWRARTAPALISVHRGLWGPAPENSVQAILDGVSVGIVELDVQLASDGVPVVFHDDGLDRMTEAGGLLNSLDHRSLTGLELRQADGGPDNALSGQFVPDFQSLLSRLPDSAFCDFDAKLEHEAEPIAAEIARLGQQSKGSIKISTSCPADIERLLALQNRYGLMVMAKVVLPKAGLDHMRALVSAGVAAAELWFDDLDQLASACAIAGSDMAISTYTLDPVHCCGLSDAQALVNPDRVWGRLIEAGVSVLMTDRPLALQSYLATKSV